MTVSAQPEPARFFIGTYTSPDGSRGIYESSLDLRTGALSAPRLRVEAANPSFLALHPSGRFLYSVHESTPGEASAYAVSPDGLRLLNTERWPGGGPCHLWVDHAGKNVLVASYGAGTLACLPIRTDGALAPVSARFANQGHGPNAGRQEGPHMHAVATDLADRFAYACDLGTDEVLTFHFDAGKGSLTPGPKAGKSPPGGGPRHVVLHPNGKALYANNELANSVTVYRRDPETGALAAAQTLPTVPAEEIGHGGNAEIVLHPSGKWLYVSNRGPDSIAVFSIAADGLLSSVEIVSAGVKEPRGFGIDPSGNWLVVGGQNSNDLTALRIDGKTGGLAQTGNRVKITNPVCVLFASR